MKLLRNANEEKKTYLKTHKSHSFHASKFKQHQLNNYLLDNKIINITEYTTLNEHIRLRPDWIFMVIPFTALVPLEVSLDMDLYITLHIRYFYRHIRNMESDIDFFTLDSDVPNSDLEIKIPYYILLNDFM